MDGIRKLRMTLLGIKDLSSLVEFSKHYWTDMNYIQRPCNLDAEKLKFKSEIFLSPLELLGELAYVAEPSYISARFISQFFTLSCRKGRIWWLSPLYFFRRHVLKCDH